MNEAQPTRLRYSTGPNKVSLILAAGETRGVDFGDLNGRPTHLPLILRSAQAALVVEGRDPHAAAVACRAGA